MKKLDKMNLFLMFIIIVLVGMVSFQDSRIQMMEEEMVSLDLLGGQQKDQIKELEVLVETLKNSALQGQDSQDPHWFWDVFGYPSTPERLLESLEGQEGLIPFDGVLGGTPFIVPGESKIIDSQYVYALIEDGHQMGGLILKYKFNAEGQVEWILVDGWWPNGE